MDGLYLRRTVRRCTDGCRLHTVRQLAEPGVQLAFIVGMDSLADFPTWRDPSGILALAEVVAVYRGGRDVVDLTRLEAKLPAAKGRVQVVPIPGLDVSSTDIRSRVAAARPIRYLVPDPVIAYIEENGLYREAGGLRTQP